MPLLTDIQWDVAAATELQEHLNEIPSHPDRIRLLTEVYECARSWAEKHCDTLRHVHPEHLVSVLTYSKVARPSHEEALNFVKAINYVDHTGETAVHNVLREQAA